MARQHAGDNMLRCGWTKVHAVAEQLCVAEQLNAVAWHNGADTRVWPDRLILCTD